MDNSTIGIIAFLAAFIISSVISERALRRLGETPAAVDFNGGVRACEPPGKFASPGEFDYDFSELWRARARQNDLVCIDCGKARRCTRVCFIHSSLQRSRKDC